MAIIVQEIEYELQADNGLGKAMYVRVDTYWLLGIIPLFKRRRHVHGELR